MSPVVIYCLLIAGGLILWAAALEWADAKETIRRTREWLEFEDLMAARDVTGRVE